MSVIVNRILLNRTKDFHIYHRRVCRIQFPKFSSYRLLLIEKENQNEKYTHHDIKLFVQTELSGSFPSKISTRFPSPDRVLHALWWWIVDGNRGRPGPEPAGWTGAVVPSPPPPAPRGRGPRSYPHRSRVTGQHHHLANVLACHATHQPRIGQVSTGAAACPTRPTTRRVCLPRLDRTAPSTGKYVRACMRVCECSCACAWS